MIQSVTMANHLSVIFCLFGLTMTISDIYVIGGYCRGNEPVLSICYEDQQRVVTSAYIDTSKVPLLQQTTCKCNITIFKSIAYFDFSFIDKEVPINMFFDVNGIALNQSKVDNIAVNGSSTLSLTTTQDFKGGAACLYISPEGTSSFNIDCERSKTYTSTSVKSTASSSTVSTSESVKSSTTFSTTTGNTDSPAGTFIYPLVGSVCVLGGLVIVIVLVCLRRKFVTKAEQSPSKGVEVESIDQKITTLSRNSEYVDPSNELETKHEYNYIDKYDVVSRISTNYYEIPSGELDCQSLTKAEVCDDADYDYSRCISIDLDKSVDKNRKGQCGMMADIHNRPAAKLPTKAIEEMYDTTDKIEEKHIIGVTDYHHLNPGTLERETLLEAYHTMERKGQKKSERKDESERDPAYHIADTR